MNRVIKLLVNRRIALLFGLFFACFAAVGISLAEQAPSQSSSEPVLKIQAPVHTASIRKVKSDPLGTYLVTASYDQTVKVWDGATGDLRATLHPPIGEGNEGKIYAVAMSSDGKQVACGGFTGKQWDGKFSVYVFDWHSGIMLRRLGGLPQPVLDLAYSPDGKYLAVGLAKNQGIRIYNAEDYSIVFEDFQYGGSVYGVDFDRQGRLVTVSDDGFIRLYRKDFSLIAKQKTPGRGPFSVSFNQNGSLIAVGYTDSPKVDVFSGDNLKLEFSPSVQGISNGNLSSVAWLSNGRLCAAGRWSLQNGINPVRCWENGGKGAFKDISTDSRDTILSLRSLPNNQLVFVSGDPSIGKIGRDDTIKFFNPPVTADFRDKQEEFLINSDGSEIAFGFFWSGSNYKGLFSINDRYLEINPKKLDAFKPPITKGLPITNWKNSDKPLFKNKPIALDPNERIYCMAISPDMQGFVLGGDWSLRLFDGNGSQKWKFTTPSPVRAVNISQDRRLVVAAYTDGTIRWHRLRDGALVLSLFIVPHTEQWVLWTPSGYYDASAGAEQYIGWHINRGPNKEADFFPISRFRSTYYRPDLSLAILKTLDEREALKYAEKEWGKKADKDIVKPSEILPPVVRILSPPKDYKTDAKEINLKLSLKSSADAPVKAIRVMIDGRPAKIEEGEWAAGKEVVQELTLPIPPQDSLISVVAMNKHGASEASIVRVRYGTPEETLVAKADVPSDTEAVQKSRSLETKPPLEEKAKEDGKFIIMPNLYVLAVGVSKYQKENMQLIFPAKDAMDFAKTIESQKGRLYKDVITKVIVDEQATRENILDGLEWIRKSTKPTDVAMIFLAGHGLTDNLNQVYYFMPVNGDPERLMATGVSAHSIQETLASINGKVILFLDACYSANILKDKKTRGVGVGVTSDVSGVVNQLIRAENGVVVFASSSKTQKSFEAPEWGNGAFTKALIEGLSGKMPTIKSGKVTVAMLYYHIMETVATLTNGNQTPIFQMPDNVPDFPIVLVDKT
ncbi:MAG: caspase family protein [Thermodesulforhabdaceae bacterium]